MKRRIPFLTFAAAIALAGGFTFNTPSVAQGPASGAVDPAILKSYQWRSIGPLRGGRSIAVSGVKGRPKEAYFGAVGGGLWKTVDGGQVWTPVTDGQIRSASVGAIGVSDSNPDIVYIGMGESCIRGNIMPGDGMYKSTDAGKTWTHIAFGNNSVDAISKIRVHPSNPDIVYAAVFGKYGRPSPERGVFKSTDGGRTWRKTLFRDEKTGSGDLVIDPNNPSVLYAALWEAYRVEYQMSSGGPGSGLFKSTDGGETWKEITRNPGLPSGVVGRIGVAVAKADSNRVYALVENANGGLFVSDDAGASWTLINDSRNIRQRAFYYTHVTADPVDKNTVYVLNTSAFKSTDGGKTLTNIGGGTHGDHHDLWVDADDPKHLVIGNDGGGAVSYAGGPGWTPQDFPTAQYYHVITTKHVPFHVCGAQQDGSTVCLASAPAGGRGGGQPEMYGAGGAEPGYIAPDPLNVDIIYAGGNNGSFLTRLDRRTGNLREVNPYPRLFSGEPSSELVERWQWTYPIVFSPADPTVLFTSSQHVWRTRNGGDTWDKISPDLSLHDPETLGPTGGPITHDMNSPEVYATVFALGPGKKNVNVLWAGTDDGLIHLTRDGGTTWANVTPPDMPRLGRVSIIDASSFGDGTAYAAVKKPLLADFQPYIFRTHDFGRTWTKIVNGIRADDYVHAVREDPTRKGLLYAATQHGVYISYDDGNQWQSLSLNLPDVPVSDLWVEEDALAISTHGRSFYVLDNIAALRQAGLEKPGAFHLYKPADAIRTVSGASIPYLLRQPAKALTIEIVDSNGEVVETIQGRAAAAGGAAGRGGGGGGGGGGRGGGAASASMAAGFNRASWALRYPGAVTFPGMILWGATTQGPLALPGTYQVRMTVDGVTQTQPLVVKKHPLRNTPDADIAEQFNLALQIRDKVSEANNAVIRIRRIKDDVAKRMAAPAASKHPRLRTAGERLVAALSAVEQDIYQVKNQSGQDPLNFPIKTNNRLASLLNMTLRGEGKPTANIYPIFEDLKKELRAETDRLDKVLATELAAFNAEAKRAGVEPIGG